MKLTYTIDINSTPEVVFSWLGSPERAVKWQTNIAETEILHRTPEMTGTTFREVIEEDGRTAEMHGVITGYEENRLLSMHLEGQYNRVNVDYHLQAIEDRTRLTMVSDIRFKSFLRIASILFWPVFRKNLLKQLDGEFVALRQLCERGD